MRARHRPLDRQAGLDITRSIAILDESVEDLASNEGHGAFEGGGWIENSGNGWQPHAQRGRLSAGSRRHSDREKRGEREYSEPTEHGALISKRPTHGASCAAVRRTLPKESAISSRTHALFGLHSGVLDCSGRWHRTCFWSGQKTVGPLGWARNGPCGHRVSSLRPIGVAEGRKWEKSNDFNGSERSFGPNSLDLPRNGPLY